MSHTLKVAQIGRRLAEYMEGETPSHSHIEVDPAVVEAAGLAHDLGHPPFSHPAETELNRAVKEATNGKTGFEGNAQAFRIVTKISTHGKFEKGLN
jgi:dGTPase